MTAGFPRKAVREGEAVRPTYPASRMSAKRPLQGSPPEEALECLPPGEEAKDHLPGTEMEGVPVEAVSR